MGHRLFAITRSMASTTVKNCGQLPRSMVESGSSDHNPDDPATSPCRLPANLLIRYRIIVAEWSAASCRIVQLSVK